MALPTGYELSRIWFNWCFENPEKITPNHTALYFFCIEHCNRLGWKEKFGLPTTMAKEAIGIRSYNTYIKTLTDLVEFGFITLVEKSKNQYSSNIVALSNFNKAPNKALDKAFIKHGTKQDESIGSIDKPLTIEPQTIKPKGEKHFFMVKETFSIPYSEHSEHFKNEHTPKEYDNFQKFLAGMFRDFTIEQLTTNFDKCLGIGDWKKTLQGKGFLIIKPALEKAIGSKEGNRDQMAMRIKTFTNGLLDEKVFVK